MEYKKYQIRFNCDTFVITSDEEILPMDKFILSNGEMRICDKRVMYPSKRIYGLKAIQDTLGGFHFPTDTQKVVADSSQVDNLRIFDGKSEVELEVIEICPNYGGYHIGKDCSCKSGFIYVPKLRGGKITINNIW